MTRNEFIKMLKDNLKPNAEMNFLLIDSFKDGRLVNVFMDIRDVCMNADVDDPNSKNEGGIVFKIQKDLYEVEDDIITTINNIGCPNIMSASELRKILNGEE